MSLESGPFLTMVTLGVAGLSAFPWQTLLGAILPLIVGMVLGNLDPQMRTFLGAAVPVCIPVLRLRARYRHRPERRLAAGLLGIGLGLFVLVFSGAILLPPTGSIGGNGLAGLAAASTAGNAAAVPALVAVGQPGVQGRRPRRPRSWSPPPSW